jgi:hypothetical protein
MRRTLDKNIFTPRCGLEKIYRMLADIIPLERFVDEKDVYKLVMCHFS